jgi:hypothetical protein
MSAEASYRMATLIALGGLAGCALVYEGKYDWDEGWRIGRVIASGAGTTVPPTSADDCRKAASPADVARTEYAEVAYQSEGRWLRHRIVPVPQGVALTRGQTVYVNVNSCGNLVKASAGG